MAELRSFAESDFEALFALQQRIAVPGGGMSRQKARDSLMDSARAGGKNVAWVEEAGAAVGAVGWVRGEHGEFFASPFWASSRAAAVLLTKKAVEEAGKAAASWLRATTLPQEEEKQAALEEAGFQKAFAFLELELFPSGEPREDPLPEGFTEARDAEIDIEKFRDLGNLAFADVDNSLPMSHEEAEELLSEKRCDPRLSGIWRDPEGRYAAFVVVTQQGYVDSIGVDPRWRKRGMAKALYRRTIESARSCGLRRLHTIVSSRNAASLGLHESLGFRIAGERQVWELPLPGHRTPG